MKNTLLMEEMSWTEIRDAISNGKTNVLLYAASLEQHGPHLPILGDTILAYAIGERVVRKLGDALLAPVIRYGLSGHHSGFPGTFTLRFDTFRAVVEDACASLAEHGFKNILLDSSHGGNDDALKAITPNIAKGLATKCSVNFVGEDSAQSHELMDKIRKKYGATLGQMCAHSGLSETSVILSAREDLVRMDKATRGLSDDSFYESSNVALSQMESFIHGIKSQSENGVLGDPRGATKEMGLEILEGISDLKVARIRKLLRTA